MLTESYWIQSFSLRRRTPLIQIQIVILIHNDKTTASAIKWEPENQRICFFGDGSTHFQNMYISKKFATIAIVAAAGILQIQINKNQRKKLKVMVWGFLFLTSLWLLFI